MPLFICIKVYGATLYIEFHLGVDDSEYIFDEVLVGSSSDNILDLLSEDVIHQIEKRIGENLDKIIEDNQD